MGCPHSTSNHKVLPSSPTSKSSRSRSSTHRTEFTSPREEFHLLQGKIVTFETSPCLRNESKMSPTTVEDFQSERNSKEKLFSPSYPSPIKGITIQPVETIIPSHESLVGQAHPGERGSKRDITFFSMENFGNCYTADFGNGLPTIHDKSSSKQESSGNITTDKPPERHLIKLITFGGTPVLSTEDLDNNNKKPQSQGQEEPRQRSSLVITKPDNFPETPGFKPVATTNGEKIDFGTAFNKEKPMFKIQRAGSDRMDKNGDTFPERKIKSPSPVEKFEPKNQKPPLSNQELINLERGQRFSFQDSTPENLLQLTLKKKTSSPKTKEPAPTPSEKGSRSPEEKRKSAEVNFIEAKRRFTQNLLDLVVPKKGSPTSAPIKKLEISSAGNPLTMTGGRKTLIDLLNDSNYQTTQVSSRPHLENPAKSNRIFFREEHINLPADQEQQEVKSANSLKGLMSPLKFGNSTDFVLHGDSISPINTKQEGATPPFSNRTFLKNFIGSGGELQTHTNVEVVTRNEFGENSFSVDAKQNEGENCNTSLESINLRQNTWKKSNFAATMVKNPSPKQSPTVKERAPSIVSLRNPEKPGSFLDISEVEQLPALKEIKSTPFLRTPTLNKYKRPRSLVIETSRLDKSLDENGFKRLNQYTITSDLGRGGFAKVKLGIIWEEGKYTEYAIKIANKKKLNKRLFAKQNNAFSQLQTEIAILKKMNHPNIVQLFEVIDDSEKDKLYLVMEFASKGAIMSKKFWKEYRKENGLAEEDNSVSPLGQKVAQSLSPELTRKYFRDLVRGLDYMHNCANIIHRDIKPENLLIDKTNTLKITDFNVSQMFENENDLLKDSAGTQAFLAPEAWSGYSFRGKPADIWAAGVCLYYFAFGKFPFKQKIGQDIKTIILTKEPEFPDDQVETVDSRIIELIQACLVKDPAQRITMENILSNSWLTDDGRSPISNEQFKPVSVSEDEIRKAITMKLKTALMIANKLVRSLNSARTNLSSRTELSEHD